MKLKFSLKNKEASVDADVEGVVEKVFEHKAKQPPKKTRYQIKQEEKPLPLIGKITLIK